eukprot:3012924-Rhodomonas_salina.6
MGVTQAEYRKEMDEMRAAKKEAQEQAKEGYQVGLEGGREPDSHVESVCYQEADVKDSKA